MAQQNLPTVNAYELLRQDCIAASTRPFDARGKSVIRCHRCQMAEFACMCQWRPSLAIKAEFVLLMHRIEVFKPTNTGRLIADIFPQQTHAYCWSRTGPSPELLALLKDPQRLCVIVYPVDSAALENQRQLYSSFPVDEKRTITFILLDGTWKQSGRMFHLSRWLDSVDCVALPDSIVRGYAVRKSHEESYLSTAEAAALCLAMAGEHSSSEVLLDYFQLFNLHYLATRACCAPAQGELHAKLMSLQLLKG